jgi:predicted kinase
MSGPAGSGKSTWAQNYAKENFNVLILSTDELRQLLFHTQYPNRKSENIIRKTIIEKSIEAASHNVNVILDSAVVKNKNIMKWWRKLSQYFNETELVVINTPLEICLQQNQMRDRHVPEDVIREMYSFKEPLSEEIKNSFTNIIIVNKEGK